MSQRARQPMGAVMAAIAARTMRLMRSSSPGLPYANRTSRGCVWGTSMRTSNCWWTHAISVDRTCSATTLRRRRDEWIALGLMDQVEHIAREG